MLCDDLSSSFYFAAGGDGKDADADPETRLPSPQRTLIHLNRENIFHYLLRLTSPEH
ncbi:hypothetical protein HanXRQr2_Chr12g0559301 [Helianthus annuus]|uniref:Uncharacterized protein n=1 Tax=Helianthus annuus TaxID=4232 RepID=A0A9K3HJG1_HELAN|nr:hypothetical protein HanXRQr2_Chr12g0559301 [Helianthus annuus]